ncbi:MAG: hypothetical protein ACLUUO_20050 [Sellimonas intestinalis]
MALVYGEMFAAAPALLLLLPAVIGLDGVWISLIVTQVVMLVIYGCYNKVKNR